MTTAGAPGSRPNPPLRHGLLMKNPLANAALRVMGALAGPSPRAGRPGPVRGVRRLLLANAGHLGDLVLACRAIAAVRQALPGVEIGLLCPSWSRVVVDGHPGIARIHTAEPCLQNRAALGWPAKLARDAAAQWRARAALAAVGYDAAIDLYPYAENFVPLLWAARIPRRIGWASGGLPGLLTHPHRWRLRRQHVVDYHGELLADLGVPPPAHAATASLPPLGAADAARAAALLAAHGLAAGGYVVVHPGAGNGTKLWSGAGWSQVIAHALARGERVVLTGAGAAETAYAHQLAAGQPDQAGLVDLAGLLDWPVFSAVVAGARLVVGVDSVAGHVAADHGVPVVAVFAGNNLMEHWRPLGPGSAALLVRVPCSPCFRSRGCAAMTCIRDVPVARVLAAIDRALPGQRDPAAAPRAVPA